MSRKIDSQASIYEFIALLDHVSENTAFVTENDKLVGVATDGDLRRYIRKNNKLPEFVAEFMNTEFSYENVDGMSNNFHNFWHGVLPVVNDDFEVISERLGVNSKKHVISAIAPTRISFAGGGSDTEKWMRQSEGKVVNIAIAKYARVTLSRNQLDRLQIMSINTGETLCLHIEKYKQYQNAKLRLAVECIKKFKITEGLTIEIYCDFEPGTGLGGSSSVVVALLKCLCSYFNMFLSDLELIELAYSIERNDCRIEGGWQDQIAAVKGGLNLINFRFKNFHIYPIDMNKQDFDYLCNSLFICRVGGTRESSKLHKLQSEKANQAAFKNKMKQIVELADRSFSLIGEGNFSELGEILDAGWELKKKLGHFMSSHEVDKIYKKLKYFGASGGKLLGAGGSGYLMVYVKPEKQYAFLKDTIADGIEIERIIIDTLGARIISE
jgi:D-glycero-alpha-D-manno-heptose-7-phosphate kinase